MISTGKKGIDEILTGLRTGDNVVWQLDNINNYKDFVMPFVHKALEENKKVVYMKFADKPLLRPSKKIKTYNLNASGGFEVFTTQVNNIITREGRGTYYVFDSLSELLSAWATDLMIGNFFMVTCPYLFELDTITYFALLRNHHSFKTIARIRATTQLLIDVYDYEGKYCIHPIKVWNRYSPTMFLPHLEEEKRFIPITDSVNASKILSYISQIGTENVERKLDYWDRLFVQAEELAKTGKPKEEIEKMIDQLCKIVITRNEKILSLAKKHFILEDITLIKSRLIGTGLIGGKAVGMLLARKALENDRSFNWEKLKEPHDSFYIGSDVFYSYIVQNGWWKLRMQQKTKEHYFDAATVLKEKMLHGKFPEEIMERFQQMIEYFGTSPFIVRSSSLLEDGYGNAFAGKYESVFCPNQGTPEQRYVQLVDAVRRIYASTMSEDALSYRLQRGLDMMDEQMALLIQRVSGAAHKNFFLPDIAGVGLSYNTYVWTKNIDPKAGMLRLVFGLGTRSVNRVEGDYPRIVALDNPLLRPQGEMKDLRKFSQHDVDLINVKENILDTVSIQELLDKKLDIKLERIAVRDYEIIDQMRNRGIYDKDHWVLTFDRLFSNPVFAQNFRDILKILEKNYKHPVDIEFTVNFTKDNDYKINLLQCRPLQAKGLGKKVLIPKNIKQEKMLFDSAGYFFGGNISQNIKRVIYVKPKAYSSLKLTQKYDIARIVGNLNKLSKDREKLPTILMGPGRWGTSTPSLGVPVSFYEINNITVLGEIAFSDGNLMPELSFGTHFFQDLVETNIFYVALFPEKESVVFNNMHVLSKNNILGELLPESSKYKDVIEVYDMGNKKLQIMSDIVSQRVVCFVS